MKEGCKFRVDGLRVEGEISVQSELVVLDARTQSEEKVCMLKFQAGSQTGFECTHLQANDARCPVAKRFRQANAANQS